MIQVGCWQQSRSDRCKPICLYMADAVSSHTKPGNDPADLAAAGFMLVDQIMRVQHSRHGVPGGRLTDQCSCKFTATLGTS